MTLVAREQRHATTAATSTTAAAARPATRRMRVPRSRGAGSSASAAALARAAQLSKRSSGSLAIPRASTGSSATGRVARRSLARGGGVLEVGEDRRHVRAPSVGHAAGQALEQQAGQPVLVGAAVHLSSPRICSGDTYATVPMNCPSVGPRSLALWVRPKSAR